MIIKFNSQEIEDKCRYIAEKMNYSLPHVFYPYISLYFKDMVMWLALNGYRPFFGNTFCSCTTSKMLPLEEKHNNTEIGIVNALISAAYRVLKEEEKYEQFQD